MQLHPTARRLGVAIFATTFGLGAQAPQSSTGLDMALVRDLEPRNIGPASTSGRVAAIAVANTSPPTIYVGAASGGLWKANDGGYRFRPIFDDQPVASIGSIAIHPDQPETLWVGTGEGNPRNSASVGRGVYKSLDGGETWRCLGLEKTERIHRVILHPSNPQVAWVAAMGQAWGENVERGVYKTTDGGESWAKVLYVDPRTGCADLVIDPQNPDKLFAAMWDFRRKPYTFRSGGPGSGLHVTRDGGRTWKRLGTDDGMPRGELGRIGLAIAPSQPDIVYALVEAKDNVILKSTNGGISFRVVCDDDNVAPRPFYYADIHVDPKDPNRIYNLNSLITLSTDGGRSFSTLAGWNVHPDHHALWINPDNPHHLINGNDGGISISHDHGRSWRFVRTLPLAQFYHLTHDMQTPYNVYGGLQDNGSWRGPSDIWENGGIRNHHWQELCFGDGFGTVPDPTNPDIGYAMSQQGNIVRWNVKTGERKDVKPIGPEGMELRFSWNAAIAPDPHIPGAMYFGSQFLHHTTDRGQSWKAISPDLTTNNPEWQKQAESGGLTPDVTGAENYTTLIAIAPSPIERGVVWTGSDDGRIHVTKDGGQNWDSVEDAIPGVPKNAWAPHIEASKYDAATAFVVFDDHRRSNWTSYVFRTDDYGKSWRSVAGKGLDGYVHVVEQDPVDPELLFAGTEFGLFVSNNGGKQWTKWGKGFPTVSVRAINVHPRDHDLVIGTHGRAAWVIDNIASLRHTGETEPQPLRLSVRDAILHQTKQASGSRFPGSTEFRGETAPRGAVIDVWCSVPGLKHPDPEQKTTTPAASDRAASTNGKSEKKTKPAKLKIVIRDLDGKKIRTVANGKPMLGLNRYSWRLRTDPVGPRPRVGRRGGGMSLPVLPGRYEVVATLGDHEAKAELTVHPDARHEISMGERTRKLEALKRALDMNELSSKALDRGSDIEDEIDRVIGLAKLKAPKPDTDDKSDDEDADEAKAAESSDGEDKKGEAKAEDPRAALLKQAKAAKKKLEGILETMRGKPRDNGKGIRRNRTTPSGDLARSMYSMMSTYDAPTEAQLIRLKRAFKTIQKGIEELNAFSAEDLTALREAVSKAQWVLLPERKPLATDPSRKKEEPAKKVRRGVDK